MLMIKIGEERQADWVAELVEPITLEEYLAQHPDGNEEAYNGYLLKVEYWNAAVYAKVGKWVMKNIEECPF